ncbi:Radical_SAM domain containing protein [uncultured Caudovirales phage]|uniref:Radical_SAM domain containing protein n=1 Tax=uncultured Caudovirales phage TaxID=2100421 RepID=A0A6J5QR73_9CAUD|nr:Radical_SAM domain containing protein [uncultured Caudovirales phage]CAB4165707.1 Radical_SAM domain containing protein [uncultured Caudovirales phage]CAB4187063.1 Radical_SAM domain containing protein [uncultured Caudovirales phage]CAB4221108.1 Radical_SAM domain containing protein [uncultured Caudovirales phage]
MDIHTTVRMWKLRRLQVLHIEPTDVCQAACPLCARELDTTFNKHIKHHLQIEHIQHHFSDRVLSKLNKMFMCGNYGDPAAGYYTMDIYNYFRKINPNITLGMNTNGAIQSTFWWNELGKLFNRPLDYCVFSIDGLESTNHVYRKNVNWEKLMSNAEAFIAAGGSAHWDMLVYKHNQHQVDAAEHLARDMGFKWFRAKISKRAFTDRLEFPVGWQESVIKAGPIQCHAQQEKSMYIDAQGRISACCWLGSRQKDFIADDLKTVKLSWRTNSPDPTCKSACSSDKNKTSFTNQWQREVQLC